MRSTLSAAIALTAVVLLAGCTTTTSGGSDSSGSGGSGGGSSSGGQCPEVAELGYFSSKLITASPAKGATFGDGTRITFQGPADIVPVYKLYYVKNGKAVQISDAIFDQTSPKGTYTTDSSVFDSDAKGLPGILELQTVSATNYTADQGTQKAGVTTTFGRYCLSLKAE
ncbi:hypothetical protein BH09ACT6_BH09ACT6_17720 [soil metagenome]